MQVSKPVFSSSAPGKIMLSGEYFVLWGATAFALPSRFRQYFEVFHLPKGHTHHRWDTLLGDELIFSCEIDKNTLECRNIKGSASSATYITDLIKAAYSFNASAFSQTCHFKTRLTFQPEWGLGSSSSLIVNVARYVEADAFALHRLVSQGSGYDVACALYEKPLLFKNPAKPEIYFSELNYDFTQHLFFLPLKIKQDSQAAVKDILSRQPPLDALKRASEISVAMAHSENLKEFETLLKEYMHLVKENLGLSNGLEEKFRDFRSTLKPLGAWGGDLALVVSQENEAYIRGYFAEKGFDTLLPWSEVIDLRKNSIQS
ncbi:MAG: hypothetical protein PWR20_1385 [Bacteroidales bacterium]|jgi:mevalonate kinase|nr:hypothetical protein [Bacteroidales bacterium]MDN5329343.1 hypothetical protein [Bacteroidales bacterium]NLH52335.1 hypothetical protein [Bacteroidales bacterium]NPV37247.1 hypothetical protein [Bacteroidales bacterium]